MDPYVVAGLSLFLILALCVAIMFAMRDRQSSASHPVSRSVWCERHRRTVTVDFVEVTHTGLTLRTVQRCSARALGERCGEHCCYAPAPALNFVADHPEVRRGEP